MIIAVYLIVGAGILKFFIWGLNYVTKFIKEEEIELTKIRKRNLEL